MHSSTLARRVVILALLLLAAAPSTLLLARQPLPEGQAPTATPDNTRLHDRHKPLPMAPVPQDSFLETAAVAAVTTCVNGMAGSTYPCKGIDLMSRVPLTTMSSGATSASNLWGYVDLDDNREYAVIGLNNGTSVVEVTDPVNPRVVGFVPGVNSQWREVKVYQFRNQTTGKWDAYAYMTTEGAGAGIQIIDLSKLPTSISLAKTWTGVSTSHTAFIGNVDWATSVGNNPAFPPILYINGANKNGIRLVSLADPLNLQQLGAWENNYAHDIYTHVFSDSRAAQCLPGHNPCEVVFNFSGSNNGLQVIDVTEKNKPTLIGSLRYPNGSFTHSGWIMPDNQSLFIMDELDEQQLGNNTLVRSVSIADLRNPALNGGWTGPSKSIEHNGYTVGNKYYMSHYTRGLVVLDVSNPLAPREVSFFDTYPTNDGNTFVAAWGVYPFLPSKTILVSDIQRGLIVVKEQTGTPPTATPVATATRTPAPTATTPPVATATRTPAPTATTPPVATATATTPPSGNLIVNPGFENASASPWVQTSSGGYNLIDTTRPRTGAKSAYMAGYNNGSDTLYQTITVPSNGQLSYWWYMSSAETGTTAYDYFRVRVQNTSGTTLATLRTWSNASAKNVWSQDTLSLAAYAGQTVRLQFSATTDGSAITSFFVDDVSVPGAASSALSSTTQERPKVNSALPGLKQKPSNP